MNFNEIFQGPPSRSKWEALGRYLRGQKITGGIGVRVVRDTVAGIVLSTVRRPAMSGTPLPPCPFGEIISWTEGAVLKRGIRGGYVSAGPTIFTEEDHEISVTTDREVYLWLEVNLTINRHADGPALPGIAAAESLTWQEGAEYPDHEIPAMFSGTSTGKVILPLGHLTVLNESAKFEPSGCGNFAVTHCPGTFSYTRG
ncbi:MAG: hypothetical protein V4733_03735 [Verrucomicrobiota bacterium]